MKKLFLPFFSLLALSCSQELEHDKLSVDSEISITSGENDVLNITGADPYSCIITSSDVFVASVSGVRVYAEHVGTASIIVSYGSLKDTCVVTVEPTITTFSEPITDFTLTTSGLKDQEQGSVIESNTGFSSYTSGNYYTDRFIYMFNGSDFYMSRMDIDKSKCGILEIFDFLHERYEYITSGSGFDWFKKGDLYVGVRNNPTALYYNVYYCNSRETIIDYVL